MRKQTNKKRMIRKTILSVQFVWKKTQKERMWSSPVDTDSALAALTVHKKEINVIFVMGKYYFSHKNYMTADVDANNDQSE